MLQISHTVKHVHQTTFVIICHGIDGKIPTPQILLKVIGKGDFLWVSSILILSINAVGSNLVAHML